MRVLVTGGAGYIGSHTVAFLRARGDFVVVLDSLELGHREAIGDTPLVVGRTQDQALVKQVIGDHRLEAIIHFAAYKAAGESMRNPAKYFDNNVSGSLCLLQAAQQAGVRRFVFSSTAAGVWHAPIPARGRGRASASGKSLRRKQASSRADVELVRRLPRPACGGLALLQCRRRRARCQQRRRSALRAEPHPAGDERRPPGEQPKFRSSAPTIPPRTAPASATTSTCWIWPRRMPALSIFSPPTTGQRCSTWAPARARRCSRSCGKLGAPAA